MKVAIVVHSKTGTTRRFADRIEKALRNDDHDVALTQLKTSVPVVSGTLRHHKEFSFVNLPDCTDYNAILVGGPVWAFTISPVAYEAIKSLGTMTGKQFLPFVTMASPFYFSGGTAAISLMSRTAREAGAKVLPGSISPKLFHNQQREMAEKAKAIAKRLR
ncbi:MAG: hypothetical protein GF344_00330 [Chitinivibrionales bacterium]|nr:hypothetical protein [Chitinivibrionales bacterium]MBD3355573.1 hypothetical protein [Chitinivibrionales bacterium]